MIELHSYIRPKWITYLGKKYTIGDYVIINWQEDDMAAFGKIDFIAYINDRALLCVLKYKTYGFDHHFNCYVIKQGLEQLCLWLTELVDYQPLKAYSLIDGALCLSVKYYVEKI